MRRAAPFFLAVVVAAIVVIGLHQASGGTKSQTLQPLDIGKALARLKGAPAPLAALHAQHSQLLGGGPKAMRRRLDGLRGYPVVINVWGSWCPPCRQEFGIFERASVTHGKRVAFLGVDSKDPEDEARKFLARYPVPYPSYKDPGIKIGPALNLPAVYPITLFLDARGKSAFVHQGVYQRLADLDADIKRYLHA